MAIPAYITIAQDNKIGGSDLLPLHSPLTWLFDVEHAGAPPDFIYVEIYVEGTLQITQKAIPWLAISSTVRQFRWDAGVILKSFLPAMDDDEAQTAGTLALVDVVRLFKLKVYGPLTPSSFVETEFRGCHGARQWGEYPNMLDIYANEGKEYNCANRCYVYYYSTSEGNALQANASNVVASSVIGLYRYFDEFTFDQTINFYKDAVLDASHTISFQPSCAEYELRYLDHNGQYRFIGFNKYFEVNDTNDLIGKVNRFATSLRDGQGSEDVVGYRNTRTIALTAEAISLDRLEALSELENSPKVYLRVNFTGTAADWILTRVKGKGLVRQAKQQFTDVTYLVEYPERYTLSLI